MNGIQNCLLIGNYGNFNIGDELLLKGAVQEIQREFGLKCRFFIPTRNMGFRDIYHEELKGSLFPVDIRDPIAILKAISHANMVVIGGGGIWSRYTGLLAHFIPTVGILGKLLRKKLHFRGIGLYSTASKLDTWLVNLAILFADSCSVRDKESLNQLWNINKRKTTQVEDLSITYLRGLRRQEKDFPLIEEQNTLRLLAKDNRILIGISIKPTYDRKANSSIIEELSNSFNLLNAKYGNHIHYVFFPFAKTESPRENDLDFVQRLIEKLSIKDNLTVVSHSNPVIWYNIIRDWIDIFIGMRYHSIVLAVEAQKPLLCIPYENKIFEFIEQRPEDIQVCRLSSFGGSSSIISTFIEKNFPKTKIYYDHKK